MFNRISLRMRLTLLTGCIIVCITVFLTLISINNAGNKFNWVESNVKDKMELIQISPHRSFEVTTSQTTVSSIPIQEYYTNAIEMYPIQMSLTVKQAKEDFTFSSIVYMFLIFIFGMIITYIISGRALKPVKDLNNLIKSINENNLSKRIEIFNSKDEIGSLADSFNTMMEKLDKSFTNHKRFSSNAAHELKTPLATIKASLQVLKLDENPSIEEYKESIDITEKSTQRLIQIVDDLLKLNSEQNENFLDRILINKVFNDIIHELDSIIDQKNINIYIHDCNYTILGSKNLIYRALFNVIENAIKYNKSYGKVEVFCKLNNSILTIYIKDTGIGIGNDEIENIFEPFYRIDKSRSKQISGSGLGLSIVKAIINRHKGDITVQSNIDIGTDFEITLPL